MSSRKVVELTENQSIVLWLITKHKFISVAEMTGWTVGPKRWGSILGRPLTEADIQEAIPELIANRFIIISSGGTPRRYCIRPVPVVKDDDAKSWQDSDILYEQEVYDQDTSNVGEVGPELVNVA